MHTYLEVIKIRWGTVSHVVFMVFGLMCNVIVTSMLMLGGCATIEDLTGMSKTWSAFLVPLGVLVYTFNGGLRATFFASYLHTAVIFFMLALFGFSAYTGSTAGLGSADLVYDSLTAASLAMATGQPVEAVVGLLENQGICYDLLNSGLVGVTGVTCADDGGTGDADGMAVSSEWYVAARMITSGDASIPVGEHCTFSTIEKSATTANVGEGLTPGDLAPYTMTADGQNGYLTSSTGESTAYWKSTCPATHTCVPAYYTMTSGGGLTFGIINIVGNFGTVFVDQAYWQSAIAAEPRATVTGFLIGGMVWFAVPFFMATTFGLAGRSLSMSKGLDFITASQAGQGLVPAKTIVETLGSGGAFALLMQLFMAVTSTGSAEVIAVSSILTYDLYWTYLNPELKAGVKKGKKSWDAAVAKAGLSGEAGDVVSPEQAETILKVLNASGWTKEDHGKTASAMLEGGNKLFEVKAIAVSEMGQVTEGVILVRMSRFFSCLFAIFMGFLSVLLNVLGLGLGFVYMSMGNIIGSAVVPVALAILYQKANGMWCTLGAVGGFCIAMFAWIMAAYSQFDEVSMASLGGGDPMLVGNIVSIVSSGIIALGGSMMSPDTSFEWSKLNEEIDVVDDVLPELKEGEDRESLEKDAKRANIQALALTFFLIILWPVPQHLSGGVFEPWGFTVWVGAAFVWGIIGGLVIVIMPIMDFLKKPAPAKVEGA